MSELVSIVYKPQDATPNPEGYTRVPLQVTQLVAGHGIEGDTKGGHPKRHLNIVSAETTEALKAEGFQVEPGQFGEQLAIAGIDVDALPVGAQLQIGASATVEIVMPRTGCAKFERYQGRSPQEVSGRMGMMATVVTGGPIQVGDPVTQIEQ
jgi:MOSC domain-containing protein YiiM